MYIWFSESVMQNLLRRYPHVSEREFNHLLAKHGDNIINKNKKHDHLNGGVKFTQKHYIDIGDDAFYYDLPRVIELEIGDDYKIYLRTEFKELADRFAGETVNPVNIYADGKLVATTKEPTPLLTITVQDKDSIPEITYRGKKYTKLKELNIQWDTMTDKDLGGLSVLIDHFDKDNHSESLVSDKYRGHLTNG